MKEWTSECWTPSDRSDTRVKDTEMKCSKQLSVELISDSVCVCVSALGVKGRAVESCGGFH